MAYSTNTYSSTDTEGSTVQKLISFEGPEPGYLDKAHVHLYFDGVEQEDAITWVDDTHISYTAPALGTLIKIARESSIETALVNWSGGAGISRSNLQKNTLQTLYLTQEAYDAGDITTEELNNTVALCQTYAANANTSATAASGSATAAATAESNANTYAANALASKTAAETAATNAAASENAASGYEADVITQGNVQVARLEAIVDTVDVTRSTRQTVLTGPDLEATPSTVTVAATTSGALNGQYLDLSMDCLTGSRGYFNLSKLIAGGDNYIDCSILDDSNYLVTNSTAAAVDAGSNPIITQPLSTGLQYGTNIVNTATNAVVLNTTHEKWMSDGSYWQYNPESGFAMCVYEGTGAAFDLLHPMGKDPLWFVVKNTSVAGDHYTGRYDTKYYGGLNTTAQELNNDAVFTGSPTDTYIKLGVNNSVSGSTHMLWGFFGDDLSDLRAGMLGMRGVSAQFTIPAQSGGFTLDTQIDDIQAIIMKSTSAAGDWFLLNKAAGWGNRTRLNSTAEEEAAGLLTVSGSQISFANYGDDYLVIVIGSTAESDSTKIKEGTKALRKYGTGATGHRVDLGHDFVSGDNGGMIFGRPMDSIASNYLLDTISGAGGVLLTNSASAIQTVSNTIESFITTGMTVGDNSVFNSTGLNQYTTFPTTEKVTTADGLVWSINRKTGFAMCQYEGNGVAGRTLDTPFGDDKVPIMMWHKALDTAAAWAVYSKFIGATKVLYLNETYAATVDSTPWNDTEPTETLITLGTSGGTNANSITYVLYAWFGTDISDDQDGSLWGVEGATAFWWYPGDSSAMAQDTKLKSIDSTIWRSASVAANWNYINTHTDTYYQLNLTAIEVVLSGTFTYEDSVFSWVGGSNDVIFCAFSSGVESGTDDQVILPATATDPHIVSIANGFGSKGNQDVIVKSTTSKSLTITGEAGKRYIYMDTDGILGFTTSRPEYYRGDYPGSAGWVYDIKSGLMLYDGATTPACFIGECSVDEDGNVYDIISYAYGDFWISDWFAGIASATFYEDNPYGHTEGDPVLVGRDSDGNIVQVEQTYSMDASTIKIPLGATLDTNEYAMTIRRNF